MSYDWRSAAEEVRAAETRIRPIVRKTPLENSLFLSMQTGADVFLKLENMQHSGSFKLRGAVNKILSLSPKDKGKGLLTASTGNHGAAFAWAAKRFGVSGTIFIPEIISRAKLESLKLYGVDLKMFGDDCIKAELLAKQTAAEKGHFFISPYNDPQVIGGQGTVAVELEDELGRIDAVLVPVGGGGLISGVGSYLKNNYPSIQIIGCQPINSKVMYDSLQAGQILDLPSLPTLADGTAGGMEEGSITFDIIQDIADDFILVSENEIKQALLLLIERHALLVEGAAALSVASLLQQPERFRNKTVVLVLSGGKISLDTLKNVLCEGIKNA